MGYEGRGFCTRERAGYRSVLIDSGGKKVLTAGVLKGQRAGQLAYLLSSPSLLCFMKN
jgi:hypothetical protein